MQKLSIMDCHFLIRQEPDYDFNSSDNKCYDKILIVSDEESYTKTISLIIEKGEYLKKEIALIVPYHTNTDRCALPAGNRIFLMLDNLICFFNLETLNIDKFLKINSIGTLFAPYSYGQDFILYGEMDIFRISSDLSIQWRFSGKDIFVKSNDAGPAFEMKDDSICLYDFEDNYYEISYDGKWIS